MGNSAMHEFYEVQGRIAGFMAVHAQDAIKVAGAISSHRSIPMRRAPQESCQPSQRCGASEPSETQPNRSRPGGAVALPRNQKEATGKQQPQGKFEIVSEDPRSD